MADRPTASTSRTGRPRTRLQSVHQSSHASVTPKAEEHDTTSKQRAPTKDEGAEKGKGKKTSEKLNKSIAMVSSDSEDSAPTKDEGAEKGKGKKTSEKTE